MPLILSGRYLPEKLLGKGGFGAAFLARDRYTPAMRPCVVKLFQPSGDLSPDQMQIAQSLFQREAVVLEDLGNRHKQIPDLFAFFPLIVPGRKPDIQEEYFYLVQEYIDGDDLEQILNRRGALPTAEVIKILVSMLKVLDFVHANGTIHRDIKPSNIMRHRNGLLYLLDFGAVKQVTSAQGALGGRSTGIYSVGYAPPEQMAGGQVYPSTDLYALAVTCIVLLTGKEVGELYDSFNNTWAWHSHVQDSLAIAPVIDQMLQATPNQRYSSAQEVLDALEQIISGTSAAPPPPLPISPTQPPQPSPSPPSSGSYGQSQGSTGTALQPPRKPPRTGPSPSPPSQPKRQPPQPLAPTPVSSVPLLTFLGGAAFTGIEGGLLAIAIASWLSTTWLGSGAWLFLVGGLLLLQARRVIERFDLVIIAAVTLGIVLLFPPLHTIVAGTNSPRVMVVVLAIMAGLAAVLVGTLFRLIYLVLSRFL